jgi:hypothetical protein
MAGLDPAIHVFVFESGIKTWITGTSPVMTDETLSDTQLKTGLLRLRSQ